MELNRAHIIVVFVVLASAPFLQMQAPLAALIVPAFLVMFTKYLLSFWLAELNAGGQFAGSLTERQEKAIRMIDRVCGFSMFLFPSIFAGISIIYGGTNLEGFIAWHEENAWLMNLMSGLSSNLDAISGGVLLGYGERYDYICQHVIATVGWTGIGSILGVIVGRLFDWRILSYAGPMVRLGPSMLLCYFLGAVAMLCALYLRLYHDTTFLTILEWLNNGKAKSKEVAAVIGLILYAGLYTLLPIFTIGAISIGDGLILVMRNVLKRSEATG